MSFFLECISCFEEASGLKVIENSFITENKCQNL